MMSDALSSIPLDRLIELARPANPVIAPDGSAIAYTISKPDWQKDAFVSQIWLVENAEDAAPRQLTFSKNGSSTPRWSPDSQQLAFLSEREGDEGAQIYRLSIHGGEAERLTNMKTTIQNLKWSPDGKAIAFSAVPPETTTEKIRKAQYGDYVEDNVDYHRTQLWLLTLEDQKVRQITVDDDLHVNDFEWHPNSRLIALAVMPSPDMGVCQEARIYLTDVENMTVRPFTEARTDSPCWSPDGQSLVYQRGVYEVGAGAMHKNAYLEVIDLDRGQTRRVATHFDEDMSPVRWSSEGIYFWAMQRTSIHLFRVPAEGGEVTQITPDEEGFVALSYSFNQDDSQIALVYATSNRYWEVGILKEGRLHPLTNYDAQISEWKLPTHELYTWKSLDGNTIEGVLTKPADFDPHKKCPLLVVIHGGPTWISLRARFGNSENRIYPLYQWVEQGAVILQPNYRGSAGYGEDFRGLNVRDLGTGDYADVISGVDALIGEGWIDAERVGAMGWSQGGYISAFITTYSDRFKAVSVGAGISNWMTYYVNTDIHPFTLDYLHATPWDDPEVYAKTSPMTYIKKAQTPTLIQHGENDKRVPLPNAFELHQGLLDQGVESKLVTYPGMPHGPNKPKQMRHIMNDNFTWFNRHIFGIDTETASSKTLYVVVPTQDGSSKDVAYLARRDQAHYRTFAPDGALTEGDSTGIETIEDITALVERLAAQLQTIGAAEVVIFRKQDTTAQGLIAAGCLQIAAGQLGGIKVTYREDAGE
ncbi:MAG: S9 family peptidase [Anaerolineae bacterium]|nr:S9 family peptidase [Anaerolineae bacterium]